MPEDLSNALRRLQLSALTGLITAMITTSSFLQRNRMSHENGITCRGRLRIVLDPTFPEHPFFAAGREFPCRIRHGAASWIDDAKLVVRSGSLKFADDDGDSPLDLLMNSGDVPLFWSARTFFGFMFGTSEGRGKYWIPYLKKYPQALVGGQRSVRRDPESFALMVYRSQTSQGFIGTDQIFRYARYRLIPADYDGVESGLPGEVDLSHPWLQNPLPEEPRSRNYLKDEIIHRLNDLHEPVLYRLQIQIREKPPGPDPEWVTAAFPWDEETNPWHELAAVTLEEALDYRTAMLTYFDLANHPPSLPVPLGVSIDDPHSMNNLRLAGAWARKARLLAYRLRGIPEKFPDSRSAPDWIGAPPMANPP